MLEIHEAGTSDETSIRSPAAGFYVGEFSGDRLNGRGMIFMPGAGFFGTFSNNILNAPRLGTERLDRLIIPPARNCAPLLRWARYEQQGGHPWPESTILVACGPVNASLLCKESVFPDPRGAIRRNGDREMKHPYG